MKIKFSQRNIPDGWREVSLGSLGVFSKGQGISKADLSESGHYAVRYGELYTRHNIKIKKIHSFINGEVLPNTTRIKKGDILFAGSGETSAEIGKSAVYLFDKDCYAGGDVIIFTPRNDNSLFLAYVLNMGSCRKQISERGQGHSVVHIYKRDLGKIRIILPLFDEQKRIVAVLETWDSYLEKLERKIAVKKNIKKGLMQQLLSGNRRLPNFNKKWSEKKIKEFAECTAGGTPLTSKEEYWGGHIRWMNSGELNFKTVTEVKGRITELGLNNSSTKQLPIGCVLIGLAGQGKTRGTVAINMINLCTNQSIAAILPNEDFHAKYLYFNLDSRYDELRSLSTGEGGRGGLNLAIIKNITVPFPTFAEQEAIANVLTKADEDVKVLEQKKKIIEEQKKFLLNNLVTGRIRTPKKNKV